MKIKYHFPILLLLVFSLFVAPSAGEVTEVAEFTSLSNQVITDQSEIWYRESAWASIGPEGDIWSDVNLQGNSIGFDQLDIQNVIPQDIQDMFQWASMWTSPANHPNDRNLQLSFTFRTNLPDVAEAAAISIINTLGSQILMQSITFEGSNGYDQNYGNGFEAFTDVWFSGHVDWTNMQQVINNSIPRTYGGLAATIDATDASNLNFQVWMNGNELAASIGINFHRFIDSVEGGHSFSLADIFHVTQFSVASYASDLSIGIWLPDIGNLAVSLGNTTYSEVYIERWEADEPQQDYSNVHVYIRLLPGALESDISIGFDYEFILWSWKNREYMRWWIDQRGYSNINMDVYGLERAAPAFELLANQTLLQDTLSVGFRADVLTMTQEGHHNIYLDLTFVGGYDYATANQTITDVATIFEGMGLEFTHQWNYSTWGSGDITQWYHKNQTEVIVDGITMAGFLDSTTQFENLVTSMYVYDKSAMLVETNVSSLDYISWWMYDEYIGKTSNINFGVDPHHWGNPVLSTDFVQNADSVTTVDLLNPYSLDWSGSIPWNEYSESIELSVHAPFVGSWEEDVSFTPETNNGFAWDSNRWYNNQNSRFHYYVNIYSDQAQIQDYNNGNPVNISALTDISANFSSYFYGDDVDLEAPYIQNLWYHDSEPHGDYLQGYPDYRRIWNSDGIFSGQQDLAVEIKESSETYWNGTTWIERFPSSGIQNATGYFFRSDAPIDHPIFTQVLDFTHNVSWVWDDPNHQIWEGAMDTTQLPDGLWQLWAEVYDNNDNFADSFAGEFEIDNYDDTYTPSVITWAADSPKENEGVGDIVDFNFVVADDAGVYAAIAWNNLGGYFVEPTNSWVENGLLYYNYTFTVDVLAQGIPENAPFTITIEVLDMDGHWSYQEVSVFVDNIPSGDPPTVSLVSPVDGLVINNSLTDTILFAIEAVDDIGIESVDLVISGPNDREFSMFYNEATGYYEYEANIQFWDLGTYTWNVVVTDVDENQHVVEGAASYSLQIIGEDVIETDTEPPVITLLSPADGDEVSEVVTIEVEVTDNDAVSQVSLILPSGVEEEMDRDGNTYSGSWDSASVADGLHTLKVEARDSNGNTAELTFQLKASNGRTASAPQIGLPGFELYLALSAFMVMIPILRRRN